MKSRMILLLFTVSVTDFLKVHLEIQIISVFKLTAIRRGIMEVYKTERCAEM